MSSLRIVPITADHHLYDQCVGLRTRVLLGPIGYDIDRFRDEFPGVEDRFEHLVAVIDHPQGERVVGTVSLLVDEAERGVGKLAQMAVDEQRRREGIGRKLVVDLERRAVLTHGLHRLYCHAQLAAVPFYEALGWSREGDTFMEAGLEHYRMTYELVAQPTAADGAAEADADDDSGDIYGV